jgi:cytidylate kinase
MNLVFIYGPPAAGKLTISKLLAEKTGYKLFHNHLTYDTAYSVFGDDVYSDVFGACCEKLRKDVIKMAATHGVNLIFTFAYDRARDNEFVRDIRSIVERQDGTMHFVRLAPNRDVLNERVNMEDRKKFRKVSSPEQLARFEEEYDIYSVVPGVQSVEIDNSNLTPEESVDVIIKELKLI